MSEKRDEYNRGGMIAFVFSLVFVCCFFVYIVFVHPGVDLGEKVVDPKDLAASQMVAKFDASKVAEPWVSSEEMIQHGFKVYSQNCAVCHGAEGKGDGAGGAGLNPKPRNLVTGPWKQGGDSIGLFTTLQKGLAGTAMAAFQHVAVNDRWAMVHWIHSIQATKVTEDAAKVAEFAKTAK